MSAEKERSTPTTIDRQELVERMMGNIQIAQRMVERFLTGCPAEMELLESMVRIGDREEIASLAHRHKGTAKTLAAPRVADIATEVGRLSREGSAADLLACVEDLREAHHDLHQALQDWQAERSLGDCSPAGKGAQA